MAGTRARAQDAQMAENQALIVVSPDGTGQAMEFRVRTRRVPKVAVLLAAATFMTAGLGYSEQQGAGAVEVASPAKDAGERVTGPFHLVTSLLQKPEEKGDSHSAKWQNASYLPAMPFIFQGSATDKGLAANCLATAAWYEAGDDAEGQRAVVQVVLNRVRDPSFPNSVCGNVFQGYQRTTGCQFSFTCDGSMLRRKPSEAAWGRALALSERALAGEVDTQVHNATHFHADYVNPWWNAYMRPIAKVGAHIFYVRNGARGILPGSAGTLSAEFAIPDVSKRRVASSGEGAQASDTAGFVIPGLGESRTTAVEPGFEVAPITVARTTAKIFQVDAQGQNGRWALAGLGACKAQKSCVAIAYGNGETVRASRDMEAKDLSRPLFVFVRDAASGMDVALWDCDRVSRPSANDCLPANGPQLARLMRDR